MGGWCRERDNCAHYHANGLPGRQPVERLCDKRRDQPEPVFVRWQPHRNEARSPA
jgi:hypothetical protein